MRASASLENKLQESFRKAIQKKREKFFSIKSFEYRWIEIDYLEMYFKYLNNDKSVKRENLTEKLREIVEKELTLLFMSSSLINFDQLTQTEQSELFSLLPYIDGRSDDDLRLGRKKLIDLFASNEGCKYLFSLWMREAKIEQETLLRFPFIQKQAIINEALELEKKDQDSQIESKNEMSSEDSGRLLPYSSIRMFKSNYVDRCNEHLRLEAKRERERQRIELEEQARREHELEILRLRDAELTRARGEAEAAEIRQVVQLQQEDQEALRLEQIDFYINVGCMVGLTGFLLALSYLYDSLMVIPGGFVAVAAVAGVNLLVDEVYLRPRP